MLEKITEDYKLLQFDTVTEVTVYTGGLSNLEKADLIWNKEYGEYARIFCMEYTETITLSEIVEQLGKDKLITVIINGPQSSEIWQYGNYGDEWYKLGEVCGYA